MRARDAPLVAFRKARAAVAAVTEPGRLDTGHDANVQQFELSDPDDRRLVFPSEPPYSFEHMGRMRHYSPPAWRGRAFARASAADHAGWARAFWRYVGASCDDVAPSFVPT